MCQYFLYYKALKAKQTRMSYNTTETQKKKHLSILDAMWRKSLLSYETRMCLSHRNENKKNIINIFFRVETETRCVRTGDGCGCVSETCVNTRKFSLNCIIVCCSITLLIDTLYSCMFLWKWTKCRPNATSVVQFKRNSVILFLLCLVCWPGSAVKCNKMYFQFFLLFYSYLNS